MCSSNFDWSIEIMDPGRSLQKEHEETPGTNWFAGRLWRSGRGSFQISEAS